MIGDWLAAPIPPRWHRCRPVTTTPFRGRVIYRCACGGVAIGKPRFWLEKNSRRRISK